ncbi:hypothetical protein K438DRAFT_915841 [Mycena galopus ATCC 62051]|nr:hypothetical protein K438DRAFT_915841 [Mycena galopus ATCC 62051]
MNRGVLKHHLLCVSVAFSVMLFSSLKGYVLVSSLSCWCPTVSVFSLSCWHTTSCFIYYMTLLGRFHCMCWWLYDFLKLRTFKKS